MLQSSRNLVCANLHEKQETAKIRAKFKENNLHTNKRCTVHFMSVSINITRKKVSVKLYSVCVRVCARACVVCAYLYIHVS